MCIRDRAKAITYTLENDATKVAEGIIDQFPDTDVSELALMLSLIHILLVYAYYKVTIDVESLSTPDKIFIPIILRCV